MTRLFFYWTEEISLLGHSAFSRLLVIKFCSIISTKHWSYYQFLFKRKYGNILYTTGSDQALDSRSANHSCADLARWENFKAMNLDSIVIRVAKSPLGENVHGLHLQVLLAISLICNQWYTVAEFDLEGFASSWILRITALIRWQNHILKISTLMFLREGPPPIISLSKGHTWSKPAVYVNFLPISSSPRKISLYIIREWKNKFFAIRRGLTLLTRLEWAWKHILTACRLFQVRLYVFLPGIKRLAVKVANRLKLSTKSARRRR